MVFLPLVIALILCSHTNTLAVNGCFPEGFNEDDIIEGCEEVILDSQNPENSGECVVDDKSTVTVLAQGSYLYKKETSLKQTAWHREIDKEKFGEKLGDLEPKIPLCNKKRLAAYAKKDIGILGFFALLMREGGPKEIAFTINGKCPEPPKIIPCGENWWEELYAFEAKPKKRDGTYKVEVKINDKVISLEEDKDNKNPFGDNEGTISVIFLQKNAKSAD